MNGFLVIDKDEGCTSHDIVAHVRKLLGIRQIGHTGTLDPMATGVLPIGIGKATRMSEYLIAEDKKYFATVRFGVETDTYDRLGTVRKEEETRLKPDLLNHIISSFIGPQKQIPPMYSAKKVGGRKLYDLARTGIEIVREPVDIVIRSIELLHVRWPYITIRVHVSKGTYIRSLAHDLGKALGSCAILTELRREESGPFTLSHSWKLDAVKEMSKQEIAAILMPLDIALKDRESVIVSEDEAKRLCYGQRIVSDCSDTDILRVYDSDSRFLGPGRIEGAELKLIKVIC